MDLILVRHAEPVRIDHAPDGPADPPLTEHGAANARRVAAWLAREQIDHVATSPLLRARQTAQPLADTLGLEPEILDGVGEFDARDRSYIPFEDIPKDHEKWTAMVEGRWDEVDGWMHPDDFRRQVVDTLDAVIRRFTGHRVAVFTHGGVVNVFLAEVIGTTRHLWFYPGYASIHRVLASRDGTRSVSSVNETAHLDAARMAAIAGDRPVESQAGGLT